MHRDQAAETPVGVPGFEPGKTPPTGSGRFLFWLIRSEMTFYCGRSVPKLSDMVCDHGVTTDGSMMVDMDRYPPPPPAIPSDPPPPWMFSEHTPVHVHVVKRDADDYDPPAPDVLKPDDDQVDEDNAES
jgi:hypothetical protein